ncbi:MAG: hypothetical protein QF792_03065 [Phycisphaerae bacterium]|nr:hypothetical protein [Phycisphaerae bacterium]
MSQIAQEALAALRSLGGVEQMREMAESGYGPPERLKTNLHIHLPPNFSAFESVEQAVTLAAEQGVGVLCAGNYYDYGVFEEFAARTRRRGIFPMFGTEIIALVDELVRDGVRINDPGNPGRMYICGKGITRFGRPTKEAARLLGIIRRNDAKRMTEMVGKLAEVFEQRGLATGLDEETIKDMVVRRCGCPREVVVLQERHLARAFQEAMFAKVTPDRRIDRLGRVLETDFNSKADDGRKIQNDIRSCLMKAGKVAFVVETFVSLDQAYRLILELGGIPCYPTLADGASPICRYEQPVEKLIDNLKAARIHCAEFIPARNTPTVLSRYVKAIRRAGLPVVAGTEHNTPDLIEMSPTCAGRQPVPEDIKDIFWEGACVVAAHQFLAASSRCGFVDGDGKVNDAYDNDNERIEAFAALGAAVIRRYYEVNG